MSNAERLIQALDDVFTDSEVVVDQALIDRMIERIGSIAADDVETVMTGTDETFTTTRQGQDGMREAWADWLGTFQSIRFEIEDVAQMGGNVLTLGRQVGVTRHGGVELEQPSAAVWKFRDAELVRVEFHLDREKAEASAAEPA